MFNKNSQTDQNVCFADQSSGFSSLVNTFECIFNKYFWIEVIKDRQSLTLSCTVNITARNRSLFNSETFMDRNVLVRLVDVAFNPTDVHKVHMRMCGKKCCFCTLYNSCWIVWKSKSNSVKSISVLKQDISPYKHILFYLLYLHYIFFISLNTWYDINMFVHYMFYLLI